MARYVASLELHDSKDGLIAIESSFHVKDRVRAVPGARWDATERIWTAPLAWPTCLAFRTEFGPDLEIGPRLREWARHEGLLKSALASKRLELSGDKSIGAGLPGFADLFDHQRVDAELIFLARRYLLLNETGTGKSRSALAGLSLINQIEDETIFPLLVCAPKSVVIPWSREINGFFPSADVRVCQGTPTQIKKLLVPGGDIYIIGWDSLRKYSRHAPYGSLKLKDEDKVDKEIQGIVFRSAIMDEVHRAQNGSSQRTRAAWAATSTCENVIGLTGTPMQDTLEDLWGVLRLIAPHEYPTKTAYLERFAEIHENYWGGREITGLQPRTKTEFFANFDARSRRMTKEMCLDLPEKRYEIRWVTLPAKLRKAYSDMETKLVAELESSTVAADNVLVRGSRLIQLANSWGDVDADGVFHMSEPSPKIDAFMDDLLDGDFGNEQLAVFSDSRQLADLLVERLAKKKQSFVTINGDSTEAERQEAIDSFQSGAAKICVLTRAGGEGITLTAASIMVRLVRSWSYTIHRQVEDRVHRIGSERHDKIVYADYIVEDTVEEGQFVRLNAKGDRAEEVLRDKDLLKAIKDRVHSGD